MKMLVIDDKDINDYPSNGRTVYVNKIKSFDNSIKIYEIINTNQLENFTNWNDYDVAILHDSFPFSDYRKRGRDFLNKIREDNINTPFVIITGGTPMKSLMENASRMNAVVIQRDTLIKNIDEFLDCWKEGGKINLDVLKGGRVLLPAQQAHELRHDILSPFLPLSNSLQAYFEQGNKDAFLLLGPAEEYEDFYCTLFDRINGRGEKTEKENHRKKILDLVDELFGLKCAAKESKNFGKSAGEELKDCKKKIENFVNNQDLQNLCKILSKDNDKFSVDGGQKPANENGYNELKDNLDKFEKLKADKIVEGIRELSKNLQVVVDFIEFGKMPKRVDS